MVHQTKGLNYYKVMEDISHFCKSGEITMQNHTQFFKGQNWILKRYLKLFLKYFKSYHPFSMENSNIGSKHVLPKSSKLGCKVGVTVATACLWQAKLTCYLGLKAFLFP